MKKNSFIIFFFLFFFLAFNCVLFANPDKINGAKIIRYIFKSDGGFCVSIKGTAYPASTQQAKNVYDKCVKTGDNGGPLYDNSNPMFCNDATKSNPGLVSLLLNAILTGSTPIIAVYECYIWGIGSGF